MIADQYWYVRCRCKSLVKGTAETVAHRDSCMLIHRGLPEDHWDVGKGTDSDSACTQQALQQGSLQITDNAAVVLSSEMTFTA
jgi:hypothetical protein